ncbi:MAG: serine hydrolase domain-containing protein, partial [Polyangiales bacterium]
MRTFHLIPFFLSACGTSQTPTTSPPPAAAPVVASVTPSATAGAARSERAMPAPAPVGTDGKQTFTSGATVVIAPGWSVAMNGNAALIVGPEPDLKVAIVDGGATSPDEAIRAAWAVVHPGFARPLKLAQNRPGRRGWEETKLYTYETSPNEKLVVMARAMRKDGKWAAVAIESGLATVEKRAAQLRKISDTFLPAGAKRESFEGKKANPLDKPRIDAILASADKAREAAGIPGEGIALVQGGKIVYEGGLGVRALGKPEKVGAHTAFMIASNTKSFTTLLLAKLVDEKKLAWDTPVASIYPAFKLGDAETTKKVLVSHLVCACTGMPRQDLEWLFQFPTQTAKSSLDLLGTMQPTTKFGETFQYSNLMASAAGYVAGAMVSPKKELGAAYDEAMQSSIFTPLGMTESTFDWAKAMK